MVTDHLDEFHVDDVRANDISFSEVINHLRQTRPLDLLGLDVTQRVLEVKHRTTLTDLTQQQARLLSGHSVYNIMDGHIMFVSTSCQLQHVSEQLLLM